MTQSLFAIGVIVFAGSLAAIQAPLNAALGRGIGSDTAAAAISFGVGFLALLAFTFWTGKQPSLDRIVSVDWRLMLGGLLGAFYVWAIMWAVPTLGILTAISGMILGQLVVAILLDAVGPFGLPVHDISLQRVMAVFLVAGGLLLSKL